MKKIGILFFVAITLLFASLYVAPSVHAEPETVDFTYTVVNKANPSGQGDTMSLPFGAHTSIDFSGLEGEFGYYVHNGQLIESEVQAFTISGSTNLIVVMKENAEDVVASFVDTNGEFLGAVYNPETDPTVTVSVSKPGYNFTGFGETSSLEDAVYVAQYSRINQGLIDVNVVGGTKDLEPVKYNDVVTLSPNSGNFSYWADEDGQVVSRNANYAFSALQDVELKAVFDQPESDAPVVYLSNVTGISLGNQSFLGYIEGDFVEYGLLASNKEEVLTLDTLDVTVIPSQALNPETNEFLRSIPKTEDLKSFRAYAKLANGDVLYSDNNFIQSSNIELGYETGFEAADGFTSGTVYNNVEPVAIGGPAHNWTVKMGTPTTTQASSMDGSQTLQMRYYTTGDPAGVLGELTSQFTLSNVTKIVFDARFHNGNGGLDVKVSYSINGTDWIDVDTYDLTSSKATYEAVFTDITEPIYVRFSVATKESAPTGTVHLLLDSIKIYKRSVVDSKLYGIEFIENENSSNFASVEFNQLVTEPVDPIKEGHTFLGWFDENENEFDFDTPITRHLVLTAKYEVNEYTITFDSAGGSSVESIQQPFGSALIEPEDPTKEGYTFDGWDPELPATIPASNETYTALWTLNDYTITFDVDGGDTILPLDVAYGSLLDLPVPTKTDFFFAGWYIDEAKTTIFEDATMPANDFTLYAKWTAEAQEVTVSFDSNEGSGVADQVVELGAIITEPADPTKDGYDFDAWYVDPELTTPFDFNSTITSDMTLYAKWSIKVYQITFDGNEGLPETQSLDVNHGESLAETPDEPTRSGYEFVGWFDTDAASGGNEWNPLTEYTANKTYFARWEVMVNEITTNYVFSSKDWKSSVSDWTSGKDGLAYMSNQGIQVTAGATGANATSPYIENIQSIELMYATNASKGAGTIVIEINGVVVQTINVSTTGGTTPRTAGSKSVDNISGNIKITVNCTTNSIYIHSISVKTLS